MPRSKSWASLGGIAPNEHDINPKGTNISLPAAREDQRDSPGEPGEREEDHHHHQHCLPEAQGHDHHPGDKTMDNPHQPEDEQGGQDQAELEKVVQPVNLVDRKYLSNHSLTENIWGKSCYILSILACHRNLSAKA
jgi:hypothetical protein